MPVTVAFLDASVLYPAPLRDLLLELAVSDFYRARWSDAVHDEWIRALQRRRPDIPATRLERTRRLMDAHVRDALVSGFEKLIPAIRLPDPDDRHVVAAATRGDADIIVTANLKDFPASVLAAHGLEAQHPDGFLVRLYRESPDRFVEALERVRTRLRNPLASGLKRSINSPTISREDREAMRRSALKWATGMSIGAEGVVLRLRYGPGNRPGLAPLAQAEQQLIQSIQRTTVGGQVAEVVGKQLNGVDAKLSDYRGKTVLVDFWATSCVPCIAGLPELRRLNADLPTERFALLSISVERAPRGRHRVPQARGHALVQLACRQRQRRGTDSGRQRLPHLPARR